jgi:hypothetical protein
MYKQLYSITLAGLIGVSAIAHGGEVTPKMPVEEVKVAEIAPVVADVAVAPIVAIATADSKKVPMLVNFNQQLYHLFCKKQKNQCWWSWVINGNNAVKAAMLVAGGILLLKASGPVGCLKMVPNFFKNFYNAPWIDKIGNILFQYPAYVGQAALIVGWFSSVEIFAQDFDRYFVWQERLDDFLIEEKRNTWHELIYELFGNPEVVGTIPVTGKYKLRGYKNYNIGQAIFGPFEFDPFDLEQVKTLLGLGAARQDLRCSKIEIIVL